MATRNPNDRTNAMPDGSCRIDNTNDLDKAIAAYPAVSNNRKAAVKRHITKRAVALNATAKLPNHWPTTTS